MNRTDAPRQTIRAREGRPSGMTGAAADLPWRFLLFSYTRYLSSLSAAWSSAMEGRWPSILRLALPVPAFTSTLATPGSFFHWRSIVISQLRQVMPSTHTLTTPLFSDVLVGACRTSAARCGG